MNQFDVVRGYGRDYALATLIDVATLGLFEADAAALAMYRYTGASTVNAHPFRIVKAYGIAGDTADLYGPGT